MQNEKFETVARSARKLARTLIPFHSVHSSVYIPEDLCLCNRAYSIASKHDRTTAAI